MAEKKMIYLQPTAVRIWHWLNALGIVTLCATGAQIRFPEYFSIFGSYSSVISLHNVAGYVVVFSFFIWLIYYVFVARTMVKLYVPTVDDLQNGLLRQSIFYFFTFFLGGDNPHHPTPDNKFNPLQKTAYFVIMFVLVPLVGLSGLLLLNVEPLSGLIIMFGGLKVLVALHYLVACCLCAFIFTHVYLATLGHTMIAHFIPMWTGWEEELEEHSDSHESH
ncbi:MAG: cytochrome b [Desulfuromonadaceae bacterium]|nr:cytochrome b [Desulfuromonadaceae bacterium]